VSTICFAGSYLVALALEVSRLLFRSGVRGAIMVAFAAAGLLAHSAFLYYRAVNAAGSPLSSEQDWYLLTAWALVVVYLCLVCYYPRTAFGLFLLPLALGLIGAATFFADPQPFARQPAARVWSTIHAVSILLAVVAMLVGLVAGLMYLGQARRLKNKRPPGRGLRLPSLEWLQRANSRAMVISTLMLGAGVASGVILNAVNRSAPGGRVPWYDPVVLSTTAMFLWLLAAVVGGAVYKPARQGRKVAYLTVVSFVFLMIALGVGLFVETRHWGANEGQSGKLEEERAAGMRAGAPPVLAYPGCPCARATRPPAADPGGPG
jgi:ABC-type uncharacterized transport system permease subunit